MLLSITPIWSAWIGGDVCVALFGVGAYTEVHSISNKSLKMTPLTTDTNARAGSVNRETMGLVVGETTALAEPFADLELWACIRYSKEKIEIRITKG